MTPLPGILIVESTVRIPQECGSFLHAKSTNILHLLQRVDASHDCEGIMAGVMSMGIAFKGEFPNQDPRSMIYQSKIGITRPAVNRALVLEYEDMPTGKSSKLPRTQCLRLGGIEIPKARLLPDGRVPQIRSKSGLEGLCVMSASSPTVLLTRTRTGGIAVV